MRTEVCITIDTEFSIGGAFTYPDTYVPLGEEVVRCQVAGREEGLGFMLDSFARHNVKATFFVEALQTAYFGDVPMGRLVDRIAKAGHDVQLHLHPCWLHFRKRGWKLSAGRPGDSCIGRSDAELDEMIGIGCYAFDRWGIPKPIALRTGGFETDRAVYRAMRRAGLRLASNIGLGVYEPADAELQLSGGRHWFDDILELPVLSFRSPSLTGPRERWRCLTLTGASWPETKLLLTQARELGISPIVLVTHAFEFVKRRDFRFGVLRPNRMNQSRLGRLLTFLRDHDDEFVPVTFQECAEKWASSDPLPAATLRVPMHLAIGRAAQNVINDRIWYY